MVESSPPRSVPDAPPLLPRAAVVRTGHTVLVTLGISLLLLTGAAAVGLRTSGDRARLVSEAAGIVPSTFTGGAAPGQIVALTDRGVVAVDSQTGAERLVLADSFWPPAAHPGTLQGLSVTPDGRQVYFAVSGDEDTSIYVVDTAGGTPPRFIARGVSPAVSPDGLTLAYATPQPGTDMEFSTCCISTIAVLDLSTKVRRTWNFDPNDAAGFWLTHADLTKLAWAPDSRRLAFSLSYEGESVGVLDTGADVTLSDATEVVVPGGGGDSRHPAWQASTGRLVVVNRAFECCFEDDYTGPVRTLSLDLAGGPTEDVLPPGSAPAWLDFDASGRHLLFVEAGRLFRRTDGGNAVPLTFGVHAADW